MAVVYIRHRLLRITHRFLAFRNKELIKRLSKVGKIGCDRRGGGPVMWSEEMFLGIS